MMFEIIILHNQKYFSLKIWKHQEIIFIFVSQNKKIICSVINEI